MVETATERLALLETSVVLLARRAGLSTRACNALENAFERCGQKTLLEFVCMSVQEVDRITDIGPKTIREFQEWLKPMGLRFGMTVVDGKLVELSRPSGPESLTRPHVVYQLATPTILRDEVLASLLEVVRRDGLAVPLSIQDELGFVAQDVVVSISANELVKAILDAMSRGLDVIVHKCDSDRQLAGTVVCDGDEPYLAVYK